jgi:GTP-binding protein
VNRWLGEERQIVDARPGTTVDSVDSVIERDGWRAVLVDTAGMRRRRAVTKGIEALSVMSALRAIERCHTALLMIDAQRGPAEQDARIAGLAIERGRALVVGLNKIDLIDASARKEVERATRDLLSFAPWAPICRVSAKTGRSTGELLRQVRATTERRGHRVTTSEANRFFAQVLERHPPPAAGNRSVRLYYISQVATHPPTFVVSTNRPDAIPRSYTRYVSNQLRERFAFGGTPIRVHYRSHHGRKDK